jgi:hypothetical protein
LKDQYFSVLRFNQDACIFGFLVPCTKYLLHGFIFHGRGKQEASRQQAIKAVVLI